MDSETARAQAFAVRLFNAGLAASELLAVYLGLRLGLYETLHTSGPATAAQLAARSGIGCRYAREWLEEQAVAGVLEVDEADKSPDDRLYLLPAGHAESLLDAESPWCGAPMASLAAVSGRLALRLIDAYRAGVGVPYAEYGDEFHEAQAAMNRGVFRRQLAVWIARELPDIQARLMAGTISVADIACGEGWSTLALAQAYPRVSVDGFDLHEPALAAARQRARADRVDDRVTFVRQDVRQLDANGRYGLICLFDALHDMAQPVPVLRACRALLSRDGAMLAMEPRGADVWSPCGDEIERFLYAVSLLHCLPVGLSETPSAATGTVVRPATVRAYAAEAGFARVDVLPIEHRFYRFYRLRP